MCVRVCLLRLLFLLNLLPHSRHLCLPSPEFVDVFVKVNPVSGSFSTLLALMISFTTVYRVVSSELDFSPRCSPTCEAQLCFFTVGNPSSKVMLVAPLVSPDLHTSSSLLLLVLATQGAVQLCSLHCNTTCDVRCRLVLHTPQISWSMQQTFANATIMNSGTK